MSNISQDDEYDALEYHARNIVVRIKEAAEKKKGVRLSSFDCHALAYTMFVEDPFAFEGYEVDFD